MAPQKVKVGRHIVEVKTTLADRVIGWFNPVKGFERLGARTRLALAGGYTGGRKDRRATRTWRPKETSANADILPDLPDLRARSRDLVRNAPIATGAIATAVTNVVGEGLTVQSTIDRELLGLDEAAASAWQRRAEREFALWTSTADFTGALAFEEMQGVVFRGVLESGDLLTLRRWREDPGEAFGTKVQLVEADRVCNRDRAPDDATHVAGVKFDADGVPTGYQVANRHPDDVGLAGSRAALDWIDVPAWDAVTSRPLALLLMETLRPDQARGVPWLAPVIEALKTLADYSEAEVRAAVISAMFTVFVTTPELDDAAGPVVGSSDSPGVSDPQKEIGLEDNGAIVELAPGQDVSTANPGRPNPAFDPFVMSVLRQIGVALEIPFEILIKHFSSSYSASRAALEVAWQFFRRRRGWLARRFCQPVYAWVIEEAVARGRLDAPGFFDDPMIRRAWLRSRWIGAPPISLDPVKEAKADELHLKNRTKSRAEIIAARGADPETVREQLAAEDAQLPPPAVAPAVPPPAGRDDEDDRPNDGDEDRS